MQTWKGKEQGVAFLNEKTIQQLNESLRGELIQPEEPGYDESRSIWNAMIDRRPALWSRPRGAPGRPRSVRHGPAGPRVD